MVMDVQPLRGFIDNPNLHFAKPGGFGFVPPRFSL
jgi:hypothetical protein